MTVVKIGILVFLKQCMPISILIFYEVRIFPDGLLVCILTHITCPERFFTDEWVETDSLVEHLLLLADQPWEVQVH